MFIDKGVNQHFISVSEQKLNSSNPENCLRKKIKLYSFDVIDREKYLTLLSEFNQPKAINNLSYKDLYTFDLLEDGQRVCFEKLFKRLEDVAGPCTNKILDSNLINLEDFLSIFKSKLLNMVRNPFCIEFTLNNFGHLSHYYPVNDELKRYYDKIDHYQIPNNILVDFKVTENKFKKWLKIMFLLITPMDANKYILDDIAENFFDLEKYFHLINIYKFKNEVCVLSDRSYVNLSALFKDCDGICFGFNLRRDAFIYMCFLPNDLELLAKKMLGSKGAVIAKWAKDSNIVKIQNSLSVNLIVDDLEFLKKYNRHAIYQSAYKVYSSSSQILI